MAVQNETLVINKFGGGINLRDDELYLEPDETAYCQNIDMQYKTGLKKVEGFTKIFEELDITVYCKEVFSYTDRNDIYRYIGISYPDILSINPNDGSYQIIYSGLSNDGQPFAFECDGRIMVVDGENAPVLINGTTATAIAWPPVYTNANNDPDNLGTSYMGQAGNPSTLGTDIWYPSFGAWHKNIAFLSGDRLAPRRVYASTAGDPTNFTDNDPTDDIIAFFVDLPCSSPISSINVLNNESLIIYCLREILSITGDNPPRSVDTVNPFVVNKVNNLIGALSCRLVIQRGNNDHYFVASQGRFYTLQSSDNFLQAVPFGLTEKIHQVFDGLTDETLQRGRLINHELRGEILFWFPSQNYYHYPDQAYVLNYDSPDGSAIWNRLAEFGPDFRLESTFVNRGDSSVILVSRGRNFLRLYEGTSFDGEPIKMIYQLPTVDFQTPSDFKKITKITIFAQTESGAVVKFMHLWDVQLEGLYNVDIPAARISRFDSEDALFGEDARDVTTALFTSNVGTPFQANYFYPSNPEGRILKSRIQHSGTTQDIIISSVVIDWEKMEKL